MFTNAQLRAAAEAIDKTLLGTRLNAVRAGHAQAMEHPSVVAAVLLANSIRNALVAAANVGEAANAGVDPAAEIKRRGPPQ